MASRLPELWVVSGTLVQIARRKVRSVDRRYPMGRTFHETWEEAHAALVDRCRARQAQAERHLTQATRAAASARTALAKAEATRAPQAIGLDANTPESGGIPTTPQPVPLNGPGIGGIPDHPAR